MSLVKPPLSLCPPNILRCQLLEHVMTEIDILSFTPHALIHQFAPDRLIAQLDSSHLAAERIVIGFGPHHSCCQSEDVFYGAVVRRATGAKGGIEKRDVAFAFTALGARAARRTRAATRGRRRLL